MEKHCPRHIRKFCFLRFAVNLPPWLPCPSWVSLIPHAGYREFGWGGGGGLGHSREEVGPLVAEGEIVRGKRPKCCPLPF